MFSKLASLVLKRSENENRVAVWVSLNHPLVLRKQDVRIALPEEVKVLEVNSVMFHKCSAIFWQRVFSRPKLKTLSVDMPQIELRLFCRMYRGRWQHNLRQLSLRQVAMDEDCIGLFGKSLSLVQNLELLIVTFGFSALQSKLSQALGVILWHPKLEDFEVHGLNIRAFFPFLLQRLKHPRAKLRELRVKSIAPMKESLALRRQVEARENPIIYFLGEQLGPLTTKARSFLKSLGIRGMRL